MKLSVANFVPDKNIRNGHYKTSLIRGKET